MWPAVEHTVRGLVEKRLFLLMVFRFSRLRNNIFPLCPVSTLLTDPMSRFPDSSATSISLKTSSKQKASSQTRFWSPSIKWRLNPTVNVRSTTGTSFVTNALYLKVLAVSPEYIWIIHTAFRGLFDSSLCREQLAWIHTMVSVIGLLRLYEMRKSICN